MDAEDLTKFSPRCVPVAKRAFKLLYSALILEQSSVNRGLRERPAQRPTAPVPDPD